MTQRSKLMMAALASAVVPGIAVAGVRDSEQRNATDSDMGIDQSVIQDTAGRVYDICACDDESGKQRLSGRVRAARTLAEAKEPGGLGFSMDRVLAFEDGADVHGPTGGIAVMVALHHNGRSRPLNLLTLDDCASVGTAIGAIHRLRAEFLKEQGYPVFTTGKIRSQLIAWIRRLRQAGHIPTSITSSWSQILETEGLWSFSTCMVHGGFNEGDLLFSGSTVTSVTNWQDMQINDPARDLAWTFAKLDDTHRNAVLTAYGRMMGSRLDDLIMLRANLWLQMEQVGDFIQALNAADTNKIMQFKAQVERLAHQLVVATQDSRSRRPSKGTSAKDTVSRPPSTITVGTLLDDTQRRHAAQKALQEADAERARSRGMAQGDETGETDRTGSAHIAQSQDTSDTTADRIPSAHPTSSSSATIALDMHHNGSGAYARIPTDDTRDGTTDARSEPRPDSTAQSHRIDEASSQTMVIPLLEREERALRDAREGLEFNIDSPQTDHNAEAKAPEPTDDTRDTSAQGSPKA